jgi:hypothetical protein
MMAEHVRGTIVFGGLLEGTLPDADDAESNIREWVAFAGTLDVKFSLEIDGNSFSLLADDAPVSVEPLGGKPADAIAELLGQLLKAFPAEQRPQIFSTLRSTEYVKGEAIQTVYTYTPEGTVRADSRNIDATTAEPIAPMTRKEKIKLAVIGGAIALVILAGVVFVVGADRVMDLLRDTFMPINTESIAVDNAAFKEFFTVEKVEKLRGRSALQLTLKRTKLFPRSAADEDRLPSLAGLRWLAAKQKETAPSPPATSGPAAATTQPAKAVAKPKEAPSQLSLRLANDALVCGYIRVEYFDRKGQFITFIDIRIAELRSKDSIRIALPIPKARPAKIALVP